MIRVLILSPGDDTGSVGINIKQAFDRHSRGISVRAVRHTDNYARHPFDIQDWHKSSELVNSLYDEADIVHWMESFDGESALSRPDPSKRTVLHHHGSRLRDGSQIYWEGENRQAIQLGSTIDLLRYGVNIRWLPNPYNLEWLASFKVNPAGPMTDIYHSPTARSIKGTQKLIEAVDAIKGKCSVGLTISEYKPWVENLRLKGMTDIYYDCPFGIGNNAIEAMGMGIPVVAGLVESQWANALVRATMIQRWGQLPFIEHGRDDLPDVLLSTVVNDTARSRQASAGLDYVNQFHDEAKVVKTLTGVYEELMQR